MNGAVDRTGGWAGISLLRQQGGYPLQPLLGHRNALSYGGFVAIQHPGVLCFCLGE